jgi:hypothetical protein
VTNAWRRLEAFVPTRTAALVLFLLAFAVFGIEALGWPMAKGRDTWDYFAYYLQLFDSSPPMSELQLFRTPVAPLVLGIPMDLGGTALLEVVFGLLFALSILAWSATALAFGWVPALFSSLLLLGYPGYATLYHQASSDAIFATVLALWALLLARTLERPSGWRFAALGVGIAALVLIRPANQVLLPAALLPLAVPVAWRRRLRWSVVCLVAALLPLGAWAVHNGIRYDDTTVARGGRMWVPFQRVFVSDKTIAPENGSASRRLTELIQQEVLTREPYRSLNVPLDAYLRNGSFYETMRLVAISDRVLGKEENYEVFFDSALEAIREHPGTFVRGVADKFWELLMQRPLREGVVRRQQTAPKAPSPTYEQDGVVLPNPQARVLVEAVPYGFVWCASDYIDSCTLGQPELVWPDPARQQRFREIASQVRAWDAELPSWDGVSVVPEILNRVTPRFPRPPLWLAVGLIALVLRRPRGSRTIVTLWACAGLVLLIHAATQGVTSEFALPVYPIFIVTALGAIAGERAPRGVHSSAGSRGLV